MVDVRQSNPGDGRIKVFGSAVVKVPPDVATLVLAVSRLEKEPAAAFAAVRRAAHAVGDHLAEAGVQEVGASRVTLAQDTQFANGERKLLGYTARITFRVLLRDPGRVDDVLTGTIAAGANELTSVTFQTSRLAEERAEARRQAVAAARAKAELYAAAAGVAVGPVLAIEDVSPDATVGHGESTFRSSGGGAAGAADDGGDLRAIDPAAVNVTATVTITYGLVGPR